MPPSPSSPESPQTESQDSGSVFPTPSPESPTLPAAAYEVCPVCGKASASRYFRMVGEKRVCLICAQRSDNWDRFVEETLFHRRVYPALRWLWEHTVWSSLLGGAIALLIILRIIQFVKLADSYR